MLRGYLWWGILIRGLGLAALGTLLLMEGNVLAEWLLKARLPFAPEDVEELTTFSYIIFFIVLTAGVGGRWALLRRLDATEDSAVPTDPSHNKSKMAAED